jgi:DNA (cytosine-5)-methyltransferase 1
VVTSAKYVDPSVGDLDWDTIVPSRIPAAGPHHQQRALTVGQRQVFRARSVASRSAKVAALRGEGDPPIHPINVPNLRPTDLMPLVASNRLSALSLFSGGGGLDLGFERAGFGHAASYEILGPAAETLKMARPEWEVHGGDDGDVTQVDWRAWRGQVDVVHGGPPCQPFSIAGRQLGRDDERDMWPAFVNCVSAVRPSAFVAENVSALASKKFASYVAEHIIKPLAKDYHITMLSPLRAPDFGVPQIRRRVFFVGFKRKRDADRFAVPQANHVWEKVGPTDLPTTMGAREALGLPSIGFDAPAPTIRSSLTGPRHTTSVLNSVAAQRVFNQLQIWPNGVAPSRELARGFVAANGHFRMSVADVALLQGFPEDWPFAGATYMQLGQIGNAVPPPLGYAVAMAVGKAVAGVSRPGRRLSPRQGR